MTLPPDSRNYKERLAGSLQGGEHLLLPGGDRSAEIQRVDVETDDFGMPALVLATLTGGDQLRIAAGSTVRVAEAGPGEEPALEPAGTGGVPAAGPGVVVPPLPAVPPAGSGPGGPDLDLIPTHEGTPESVVAAVAQSHPRAAGVLLLSERLAKGINTKSGSCLKDLSDLAHGLFIMLQDDGNALAVADLLNVLPFDGNPDRWASVEASLALSSYICRQLGQEERAAVYEELLRAPEAMEPDPFKARINAKVRQRLLNEPNLYDKEIARSIDNADPGAERDWRLLRLQSLLFLRAHGGSETLGADELDRRIGDELGAVRS